MMRQLDARVCLAGPCRRHLLQALSAHRGMLQALRGICVLQNGIVLPLITATYTRSPVAACDARDDNSNPYPSPTPSPSPALSLILSLALALTPT